MNSSNSFSKVKKLLGFSIILLVTTGTAGYLLFTLWKKDEAPVLKPTNLVKTDNVSAPVNGEFVFLNNDVLSRHLAALNKLDEHFVDLLTQTTDKKAIGAANQMIYVQEESFRGSIDSIFLNAPDQKDANANKLFNSMIGDYRTILENRRLISSLRNVISLSNNTLKPGDMELLKIQNEVREKTNLIASLETKIKELSVVKEKPAEPVVVIKPEENVPVSAKDKDAIAKLENKITALTMLSTSLKQDNDKLERQNAELTTGAEVTSKNKQAGFQQRIDAMNAELRLAQVDCNLSRVDAAKIIYTARQRKELLSEASGILSSLSNSDDAAVRKKVQDKITRLNQVAANSRD